MQSARNTAIRCRRRDGPVRRGAGAARRTGATAEIAARFGLPVLLVLDVSGQSQTAAAVVRGLASHDADVRIAGVVLNRVGSERHRALVADAHAAMACRVLGAVPRDAALAMPERHLRDRVQANEHADLAARLLNRLADMAERHFDLDRIAAMAAPPRVPVPANERGAGAINARLGLAIQHPRPAFGNRGKSGS